MWKIIGIVLLLLPNINILLKVIFRKIRARAEVKSHPSRRFIHTHTHTGSYLWESEVKLYNTSSYILES